MGKTVLLTGSARGIAVPVARHIAAAGYDIALNYRRSRDACEKLAQELSATHGIRAICLQADVSVPEEAANLVAVTVQRLDGLYGLVHVAGPFIHQRKRLTDHSLDEWRRMIDGNLSSAFYLLRAAIPVMRPQGIGRIVTVGFDRVEQAPGFPYRSAYAAAKSGLASLTRTAALEERENGITANMICPGDIRGRDKEAEPPDRNQSAPTRLPVGGDLAPVVRFLLSASAQYMTGNILSLTGDTDVLGQFDGGNLDVVDRHIFALGTPVHIIPWNRDGHIIDRQHRHNRRTFYTVKAADAVAEFTHDQLIEVHSSGV